MLKEVVVGHLTREDSAFILSEAVKERMAEYAGNGQKLTEEDAIEEIVAEAVPTIFANEESVKAFVGKDRTLAEKVRDFIVKFVKEIREIAEKYMLDQGREEIANLINKADALTEIAETFDRALEAAAEKEAAQDSGKAVFAAKKGDLLPRKEFALFYEKIGEMKIGKEAQFHISPDGLYIFDIENKLVYTDGKWSNPGIAQVIEFDLEDGTELDTAKFCYVECEDGGMTFERIQEILRDVFGKEVVRRRLGAIRRGIEGKAGRRTGADSGKTGGRNSGSEERKTKFSLNKPVERVGELVAVHNVEPEGLMRSLNLGGIPAPSIAIIKSSTGHAKFGPVSLVFHKDSIDPAADTRNRVYGYDAWTPDKKNARIEYEVNEAAESRIRNAIYAAAEQLPESYKRKAFGFVDSLGDKLNFEGGQEGLIERANENRGLRAAYLASIGKPVVMERTTRTEGGISEEARAKLEAVAAIFNHDAEYVSKTPIKKIVEEYGDQIAEAWPSPLSWTNDRYMRVLQRVSKYLRGELDGRTVEVDNIEATDRKIDAAINEKDFRKWLRELFANVQGRSGIVRNVDQYDKYGNRKSFAQTHYDVTAENIVRAMYENAERKGANFMGASAEGIAATASKEYKTIHAIRKDKGRLQTEGTEEHNARYKKLDDELNAIIREVRNANPYADWDAAATAIMNAAQDGSRTATAITRSFRKNQLTIDKAIADRIATMYKEASEFPTGYFEAKPERVVGFEEIRAAIVPDSMDADIRRRIGAKVQNVIEYPEGDETARLDALNSLEDIRFSLNNRSPYGPNQPYDWEGDGTYTSFKSAEEARSAAEEMRMDVETEAFMEWFAGSKVVDDKGEPKIMYHGTSGSGFTQFDTYGSRYGLMGTGSYFTDDPEIAEKYTKKGKGKTPGIYPVYLSIQNPADMDQKITAEEAKAWRRYFGDYVLDGEIKAGQTRDEALRAVERGFEQEGMLKDEAGDYVAEFFESQGFDGITHVGGQIFGGTKHRVYIAFEPTQVKSATGNFGDFSAEDADIRFSLNDTSKAESVFTEEGKAMAPDVQLRSKTVAAYAAKALKTGLTVKMEQQITGVANKILKETGSSYDKSTMIENLKKVIGEYAESGATEETLQALTEMSKAIIEKSSRRDDTLRNQYADLRKKLRETPISLTETQKQEAANEAGSYGEWRKGLFGAVNLTSDGISLDSLWGELSSQYPDLFPPETGEAEMAGKIKDFALMMRPRYENPYGMDMDSAALEMGMRLQGDMMVVAGAKDEAKAMYGTAEKLRQKALDEYKEKLKGQKQQRVADFQKIAADLKAAKAAGDSKAQAAVMNRYRAALKRTALDEAFAEVRATYREREAQKAENRMRAELRGKAEKRAAELMEMLAGRKKGKRVPTVLQGVVMDVLEALDINGRNAAGVGEETVKSQAFREKLGALREFYERVWNQQSRGESPDGLDGLMMTISERNIAEIQDALSELGAGNKYLLREMDSQQLRSLNELLKTVKHTVESVGKLWKMKRYASIAQMGDDAIREMDDRGARRFTEDTVAGKGRDFFALDMMEPVSYGERLGKAGSDIIQGLMDGEKVKFGMVRGAAEATKKMLKDTKTTGYDIGKWRKTIREVKLGDGRTVRMSETQLMSLYLTAKRAQGMKHLLGEGMTIPSEKKTGVQNKILLTQADITKMAGMISDQQRALADRMGRYLSTELAKAGNDVTQRLYLYDAFTEANYWPITSDPNELKTQEPEGERAFNAIVNAGFTKPVNQRASNPVIIMDAFDVFNRHVGEMASYVGYAEVMTDALAWLNYRQRDENGPTGKSVKDSMDKLLGKGGIRYLTKLIQDINGARRGGDGLQFAGALLRNYKIAAVAGKIRVAIQQPTSIVRAAAEINPVYLLKGIKTGKGATQEMQKWSSLAWWKANGNYDIGVGKGTDEILWGKTERRDAAMEKISTSGGLIDPGKMDDWAWARMWSAIKREVKRTRPDLKEGSDEYFRAVAERFEYVVDRTQVVDTVMHRSDIMRTKDGLTQSLTAFKSEPIKSYNMLMRAIMEAGRNPKDKKAYAKVARATAVFVVSAAATAAATALVDAFKNRDDDDELWEYLTGGEFGRDYAEAFLNGFMSNVNLAYSIPLVGEALEAMKGEDVTMMQFDSLSGIYKAVTTFYDHFFGENKKKTTVWGGMKPALTTISQLAGLPVSGLMANAEILLRMYDPKLLQAKDDMQTTKAAYGKLYEATVEGDNKTALSVRTELTKGLHGSTPKTPKEIDTGVARILAATDERILKAWQMREKGNQARELAALHKEIQKDGFTYAQTKYAVNNVESIMNGEYESLMEEGKKQEAEAIRAKMAKYGMEPETPEEKDMTEELEARTYQYKHLFAGIRNGDTDDVAVIAEVMEAESDAKDPAKSIRGEVSGEFKAEYIALAKAGKTREAEALAKKLAIVGIDSEDIEGWVKDDSYADMKEYVAAGNVYGAREAIERAIENGATVSGVVSSLNGRFKQEYVDLVMAGRNAEADRMAEVLQELGLYYKDGGTNYFRQSKLNEWVKEAEKKE